MVLSLFESATDVHRFVVVLGVVHAVASGAPVHVYNVTFVVLPVPTVSASLAVISTSASRGTNDWPFGGPPPLNAGMPARETTANERIPSKTNVAIPADTQTECQPVCDTNVPRRVESNKMLRIVRDYFRA